MSGEIYSLDDVHKIRLGASEGLSKTTGWRTWNAALVSIEYLKTQELAGKSVCDVSSGNGLLALCAERLGADEVIATECVACLPLLERNIADNQSAVRAVAHAWGESLSASLLTRRSDLIILSDLLFIAFRDSIEHLLLNSILLMAPPSSKEITRVVLCYEERLVNREEAFLAELHKYFDMNEVEMEGAYLECMRSHDGDGDGDEEGGGATSSLFYEDPPVRLLVLTRK